MRQRSFASNANEVTLRNVEPSDIPVFFEYHREPESIVMAAFTARDPDDRAAFEAHWARIMADERTVIRTIVAGGQVAGNIAKFEDFGEPEVGYWIGRAFWGKGIATAALRQFLDIVPTRPLVAHAVRDNLGSIRVLQKCGFIIVGTERSYAKGRGEEVDELVLRLDG